MLTLSQIEPRTPVDAAHTPGDVFNSSFIITQPGSYYLTTNIVGQGIAAGISIATNNVTLNLNGFSLLGNNSSVSDGIDVGGYANITVCNGTISGWGGYGINCNATNVTLERLTVSADYYGLYCADDALIRDCTVNGSTSSGIWVGGSGSLIIGNNCVGDDPNGGGNTAAIYITGSDNRVEANHVSGPSEFGIVIPDIASYTNNIIIKNSVEGSSFDNYSFNASQIVGPLITNGVSGIITNSNPWANFSF